MKHAWGQCDNVNKILINLKYTNRFALILDCIENLCYNVAHPTYRNGEMDNLFAE